MEIIKATKEDINVIDKGLVSYNESQVPFSEYRSLNFCIKENDEVM